MTSAAYGVLLSADDIRQAAITHVTAWSPSYLDEVARARSIAPLPAFQGFDVQAAPTATYPLCVVVAASTTGAPERARSAPVAAVWTLAVASVLSGATRDAATRLASLYGAAVRGLFVQHPGVSGIARGCTWQGERIREVRWNDTQAVMACTQYFALDVPGVVDPNLGLTTPPVDPTVAPVVAVADTVITTLQREPLQ